LCLILLPDSPFCGWCGGLAPRAGQTVARLREGSLLRYVLRRGGAAGGAAVSKKAVLKGFSRQNGYFIRKVPPPFRGLCGGFRR